MKVLIVFREDDTDNLFVPVLCEAIRKQGIDVHCSGRMNLMTSSIFNGPKRRWDGTVRTSP